MASPNPPYRLKVVWTKVIDWTSVPAAVKSGVNSAPGQWGGLQGLVHG